MHITVKVIITIIGINTISMFKPREAAFKSFIPCVNGNILTAF